MIITDKAQFLMNVTNHINHNNGQLFADFTVAEVEPFFEDYPEGSDISPETLESLTQKVVERAMYNALHSLVDIGLADFSVDTDGEPVYWIKGTV